MVSQSDWIGTSTGIVCVLISFSFTLQSYTWFSSAVASRRGCHPATNIAGSECVPSPAFPAYAQCWHGSSHTCRPDEFVSSTIDESSDAGHGYEWRRWLTGATGELMLLRECLHQSNIRINLIICRHFIRIKWSVSNRDKDTIQLNHQRISCSSNTILMSRYVRNSPYNIIKTEMKCDIRHKSIWSSEQNNKN